MSFMWARYLSKHFALFWTTPITRQALNGGTKSCNLLGWPCFFSSILRKLKNVLHLGYFVSSVVSGKHFDVASLVNLLSKNGSTCLKIQDVCEVFARLKTMTAMFSVFLTMCKWQLAKYTFEIGFGHISRIQPWTESWTYVWTFNMLISFRLFFSKLDE